MSYSIRIWLNAARLCAGALLVCACSPSLDDGASNHTASEIDYPLPFKWQVPARLNVRETLELEGRKIKVRYDLNISAHESFTDHLILSFSNTSPIELDGQQVNLSTYPTDVQQKMRLILSDYYSRPSLIVNGEGEVVQVIDIEKSVRALVNLSYPNDVPSQLKAYESAIRNSALLSKVETNAYNVHGCLIRPWINFATPEQSSDETLIDMVLVDGGLPVPAMRRVTNHGWDDSGKAIHLESNTTASGTKLAEMMLDLTFQLEGKTSERPSLEGIATASRSRVSEVKLHPETLQPHWARCVTHFVIESSDTDLLPSTDTLRSAEFEIQWL